MNGPAELLAEPDPTTVVRLDHVQLYYTYMGTPLTLTEAEAGWLTLSSDGIVSFFEGRAPELGGSATYTGASPGQMIQRRRSVRLDFSGTKRFAMFTGLTIPTGEGLERGADVVEAIGETLDSATLKILALAMKGGGFSWQSLTNPDKKQRRDDARTSWRSLIEAAATSSATEAPTTDPVATRQVRPRKAATTPSTSVSTTSDPAENSPNLVAEVAARLGCDGVAASEAIDALFRVISTELEATGRVRVHPLGTFTTATRDETAGKPRTSTVSFRPAASFQEKLAEA
jgi:nucleoid DNA-binding protein